MNLNRSFVAVVVSGLSLLAPACATTRAYPDRPAYDHGTSAYDEGYRMGMRDGQWAGYRDLGKPVRRDFWRDGRYRAASEGYRPEFGSKAAYADGYRAGYERGYRDRREHERHERR
jgi:hypothetical protein